MTAPRNGFILVMKAKFLAQNRSNVPSVLRLFLGSSLPSVNLTKREFSDANSTASKTMQTTMTEKKR